jgi:RND family efflux transporter MFP subunit
MKASVVLLVGLATTTACGRGPATDDHGHEGDTGHAHGEASAAEPWAVTAWGDVYEIFPEVDALVAGHDAASHVHVTVLDGFAPLREGRVSILLRGPGDETQSFTADAPARDGIFTIDIRPSREGEYTLAIRIEASTGTETIEAGTVRVGAAASPGGLVTPPRGPLASPGDPIGFLKEQQWRTAFGTEWVSPGHIRTTVRGPARVRPAADGEVLLTAPLDAVLAREPWPWPGRSVAAGETVLHLVPRTSGERSLLELEAEVRTLEAESRLAAERAERLEELLAVEATSRAERDRARAAVTSFEARLAAARADLGFARAARTGALPDSPLSLAAPWAARVAEVRVTPGESVAAGAPLVRLVKPRPVWLEVALRPEDAARLTTSPHAVHLRRPGSSEPLTLAADDVRLVARAPELDPRTATRTVLLELRRDAEELPIGTSAQAEIVLDGERGGIVIPDSALVDDGGLTVVYVQLGGESFARREVRVLAREGQRVLVDGLREGERLVSRGGAAIRRATLLGAGAIEGHVH